MSGRDRGHEETIKNLETYRGYLAQLADPRKLTEAQAQEVIAKAKPIYHLMGGLHSGETGPPEMLMELAYRLAVEDSPLINADPRQRHRHDHAGGRARRPRPLCRLVLPLQDRRDGRAGPHAAARRTGANTSFTTTTATSITRR